MGAPFGSAMKAAGSRAGRSPAIRLRRKCWMVCQYPRCCVVSSEKHETPSEAGVEGRGGDTSGVAVAAEVMGGYGPLLEPPEVMSRAAKAAKH
jgi:hypothetical protein